MKKEIYEFDNLDNCYSFHGTTVSYLINEEKRIKRLLDTNNGLTTFDKSYLRRRHDEIVYLYSTHRFLKRKL